MNNCAKRKICRKIVGNPYDWQNPCPCNEYLEEMAEPKTRRMNDFSDMVLTFTSEELKEHDTEVRADAFREVLNEMRKSPFIDDKYTFARKYMEAQLKEQHDKTE